VIEVVRTGPLSTVQDLGRPGLAHLGVGHSGAADRAAARLANRLVGNAETAAVLEVTLGGLALRFERATTIALTGAALPIRVGGGAGAMCTPVPVGADDTVTLGQPEHGVRTYVAVRGGIAVEPILGSRSTDTLSGLGPPALFEGIRLPVGDEVMGFPNVDVAPVPEPTAELVLEVLRGPRDDWFVADALDVLVSQPYDVTPESDRIGLRLRGPALERRRTDELPSEGMVEGSLQVTPDGMPVLFLADHPVTGGYPVIAVVNAEHMHLAAQARPGQQIRFRL